jgi:hypothetical protein
VTSAESLHKAGQLPVGTTTAHSALWLVSVLAQQGKNAAGWALAWRETLLSAAADKRTTICHTLATQGIERR